MLNDRRQTVASVQQKADWSKNTFQLRLLSEVILRDNASLGRTYKGAKVKTVKRDKDQSWRPERQGRKSKKLRTDREGGTSTSQGSWSFKYNS